jgi:hypothetical protein
MTTYKLDCNKIIKLLNNWLYTSSLKTKIVFLHYTGRYNWQRDNETHMHAFLILFENFNITRGRGGACAHNYFELANLISIDLYLVFERILKLSLKRSR